MNSCFIYFSEDNKKSPIIGKKPDLEGTITAKVEDKNGDVIQDQAIVRIVPPPDLPENGIEFKKDKYKIKNNKKEKIELRIDNNVIQKKENVEIKIKEDEENNFKLYAEKFKVVPSEEERIIKKRVGVEGNKIGSNAILKAKLESREATCELEVVSIKGDEDLGEGLIKDIRYSEEPANRRRGFENGVIKIFLSAPLVKKYNELGRDSKEFQILKAELINQTWTEELARHRVEKSYSKYAFSRGDIANQEAIDLEKHELEKNYAHYIHQIWIDLEEEEM